MFAMTIDIGNVLKWLAIYGIFALLFKNLDKIEKIVLAMH